MPLQQLQLVSHSALHRVADPGGAWLSLGQAELGGSVATPETTPWGGGESPGGRQHPQELGALCSERGCEHSSPLPWVNGGVLGSGIGLWLWFCFPIDLFAPLGAAKSSVRARGWAEAKQGGRDVTLGP